MAYLISENVAVFPIAKERKKGIDETRLITEHNLSQMIRQLLVPQNPGFIISTDFDADKNCNIKFNLYGYTFEITITTQWLSDNLGDAQQIFASILIDKTVGEISGQDSDDGTYEGLNLTGEMPNNADPSKELACIQILNVSNGEMIPIDKAAFLNYAIGGINGKYL